MKIQVNSERLKTIEKKFINEKTYNKNYIIKEFTIFNSF